MSLGPQLQQEDQGLSKLETVRIVTRKAVKEYFENPLYYLFYGALLATILGLFFGIEFSWQFYVVLGSLGATQGYKFFFVEEKPEVKKD